MSHARHRRRLSVWRRLWIAFAIVGALIGGIAVFVSTGPDWGGRGNWIPGQRVPQTGTLCRGLESSLGTLPRGMDLEVAGTASGDVTVRASQVESLTATVRPDAYRQALCGLDEPVPPLESCALSRTPERAEAEREVRFPLFVAFRWKGRAYGATPIGRLASAPTGAVDCTPPTPAVALDPDAPVPPLCAALGGDVEDGDAPRSGSIAAGATVVVGAPRDVTLMGRAERVVDVQPVDAEIHVDGRPASATALRTTTTVIARALRCD
jgi:hypothetical protein